MQMSDRLEDDELSDTTVTGEQAKPEDPVGATLTASRALVGVISRSVSDILDVVSLPQYRAMVALSASPLLRRELAARLGGDSARVGALLNTLFDEGWVNENDNGTVALTAHGLQLVAHVEAKRSAELAGILESLPPADRRAVSAGFTIFATAAAVHHEGGKGPTP